MCRQQEANSQEFAFLCCFITGKKNEFIGNEEVREVVLLETV